ncbi:SDR family oxidoreductase [uncultured Methylobacterium sp.]|jgi:meso-butanediol dehydrogenase/(S,S)-butanediol dehydrogenase/diacetyl reductase|uniref:SDR family oxidoreductase n=1 Tax=uncultured Methylobacterium sp. TaxID=157278 RepID=UPI0026162738|nr:SDR family oxidoreductase [uncultured Methylobacterium sp.]
MKLDGRIAIITGGGSGIGHEAARLFADEGAVVIVADRDAAAAGRVAAELTARGARAEAATVDVAREAEVAALIEATAGRHGRLDILVNNAGYGIPGTVVDTSEADWDALMAVNVKGVFFGCKYAVPVMERQGGGVIVNTASAVAAVGILNRAAYVASKGAVAALTRAVALDHVGAKIRANCVAPGTIESPYFTRILSGPDGADLRRGLEMRQAMERLGQPIEIAKAILFLASDDSSFCTGTMLVADGGWTAR